MTLAEKSLKPKLNILKLRKQLANISENDKKNSDVFLIVREEKAVFINCNKYSL